MQELKELLDEMLGAAYFDVTMRQNLSWRRSSEYPSVFTTDSQSETSKPFTSLDLRDHYRRVTRLKA